MRLNSIDQPLTKDRQANDQATKEIPGVEQRFERPLLGIALVALAVLFFAVSDVVTKYLSTLYPVPVIVAVRYVSGLAILLAIAWPRFGSRLWRTKRTGVVIVRGLVLALGSLSMGLALSLMPVGETVAILYLSPFAVMALSVPLLGERVTPLGWFLAALGFSGVLLVLRPGGGLDPAGVAYALINAGLATGFHLVTRSLTRTESTIAMLFYVMVVGTVFFTVAAIPSLDEGVWPTFGDLGLMIVLGAISASAHFLFAAAYREAPASVIAPVNYLHLVWAALLGWAVFGHIPEPVSMLGIAMIAGAGAAIAFREHVRKPGNGAGNRL